MILFSFRVQAIPGDARLGQLWQTLRVRCRPDQAWPRLRVSYEVGGSEGVWYAGLPMEGPSHRGVTAAVWSKSQSVSLRFFEGGGVGWGGGWTSTVGEGMGVIVDKMDGPPYRGVPTGYGLSVWPNYECLVLGGGEGGSEFESCREKGGKGWKREWMIEIHVL